MGKERIDTILKDKLRDYRAPSETPAWSEMERRMILAENEQGIRRRRMPLRAIVRYGAAAAVMLLVSVGVYRYVSNTPEEVPGSSGIITHETAAVLDSPPQEAAQERTLRAEKPASHILQSARRVSVVAAPEERKELIERIVASQTESSVQNLAAVSPEKSKDEFSGTSVPAREETTAAAAGNAVRENFETRDSRRDRRRSFALDYDDSPARPGERPWMAMAYTTSAVASSGGTGAIPNAMRGAFSEVNMLSTTATDFSRGMLKHKMPVTVGINFRRYITDRFAVESGISYSYLESTGNLPAQYDYKIKQKVHTLGIPLNLSYSFVRHPRWDVYAIGGGMVEWVLSAKGTTTLFRNDQFRSRYTENIPIDGTLWSLSAGLGVGYNFIDNFGIYLEPGANYYFTTTSPYTYRTEHPWSFNLKVGLRMKF